MTAFDFRESSMSTFVKDSAEDVQKKRIFITLDGLRGVAALCVAIRHAPYIWGTDGYPMNFFRESYLAVDFFFVLSGFVLAFAYQDKLSSNMSIKKFASVRAIRLYPLYILSILISIPYIIWLYFKSNMSYIDLSLSMLATLLMLPNPYVSSLLFPYNVPVWSLFFENISNLVFGLIAKLMQPKLLIIYLATSGIILSISVWRGWSGFGAANGPMDAGPTWDSFGAGLIRVSYSFFAGVFVYHLRRQRYMYFSVSPFIITFLFLLTLVLYPPLEYMVLYDLIVVLILFPIIVLLGSYNNPTDYLRSRAFEALGDLSYGAYVLQIPIYFLSKAFLSQIIEADGNPYRFLIGIFIIFILISFSSMSFYFYDQPIRKWIARKIRRKSGASFGLRRSSAGSS